MQGLEKSGFRVESAVGLGEALPRLTARPFDIILAEVFLPDGSGLDLVVEGDWKAPPVVVLADRMGTQLASRALAAGALDVLIKGPELMEVLSLRVRRQLALAGERKLLHELIEENERLVAANHLLSQMSLKDPLTGLLNRRGFEDALSREAGRAPRQGQELAVVCFDLDHFQQINDRFGREGGDEVLRGIAQILRREGRIGDEVARLAGEEFTALLPSTGPSGALCYADRVRQRVEKSRLQVGKSAVKVTLSAGVAVLSETPREAAAVLQLADERLLKAKRSGRNRVTAPDNPTPNKR
jgi:diguanylate cyclase (GGDEF)-like protein